MDTKDILGVRDGKEGAYVTGDNLSAGEAALNASTEQLLIAKVLALPTERRAVVEDFVDFLRSRMGDRWLADAATKASEPALKAIWDNDQDAAYDRL